MFLKAAAVCIAIILAVVAFRIVFARAVVEALIAIVFAALACAIGWRQELALPVSEPLAGQYMLLLTCGMIILIMRSILSEPLFPWREPSPPGLENGTRRMKGTSMGMRRLAYVRVHADKVVVTNLRTGAVVEQRALRAYATSRVLVGDFEAYEATLRLAFSGAGLRKWWTPRPRVLVHAIHSFPDALSGVEERVMVEGCLCSGAAEVRVHKGRPLSDDEVAGAFDLAGTKAPLDGQPACA